MGDATLHGAAGGDEALREHLATEETAAAVPWILPAKQVHLDALEIEVRDEPVERITHARARVADFRLTASPLRDPLLRLRAGRGRNIRSGSGGAT